MASLTTIDFHGDTLFGFKEGDKWFVAITPICKSLGIKAQNQRAVIEKHPILAKGVLQISTPSPGGDQETYCLRQDLIPGWLFLIDPKRVKETSRELVLIYQGECFRVLQEHFFGKATKGGELSQDQKRQLVIQARLISGPYPAWKLWMDLGLPAIDPPPNPQQRTFWDANGPKLKLVSGDEE